MRHIFIVNPSSGPQDATGEIERKLQSLQASSFCEIYVTRHPGDATEHVRSLCAGAREELRFYACGGDGTLNEVVNGAAGFPGVAVGCYPCGSGNDFVKYFGGKSAFLDVRNQLAGETVPVDLIRVNDRYAINVVNIGFEAKAAARMVSFRRFPLMKGPRSYYPAVAATLVDGMKNPFRLEADGELLYDGSILLCTMANGEYVGGSFRCAPRASTQDGLLEVCMVTPVSRLRFAKLIGFYQRGEHLDTPAMKDMVHYRRAAQLEISGKKPFMICLDGEILTGSHFTVACLPGAMQFIVPQGAAHSGQGVDMAREKAV